MVYIKKLLLLFLFTTLSLFSKETVNIVYNSDTPPLKFTDNNNNANGMLIEIWKLWAEKNNFNINFIEAPWNETLNMIKDGRADIHAGIYFTKTRDKFLDYTSKPLYENKKYFFYNNELNEINKIDDFKPYVIGVDNGYPIIYMKEYYPKLSTTGFDSANSANRAFFNNEIKVVLSSLSTFYYYLKKYNYDENMFRYDSSTYAYSKKYYGAVRQGNSKLLKKINKGFNLITNEELLDIELKWTKNLDFKELNNIEKERSFSRDEYLYLNKKKKIKMCVDPSWLPFENIEENKHKGIVADVYLNIFQKKLDIPIELVRTNSWSESLTFAKFRKCDILSAVAQTPYRKKFMNFSKPFMIFPEVMVTREKEPFIFDFKDILNRRIGVVQDSAIAELIKDRYPQINLVETKNIVEGLFKVSSGELYGFINTTAALSYAIAKNGMTNLKIASKVGIDYKIRVAVRNDEPELLSIFNKIIDMSDKKEIKKIKDEWLKIKVQEVVDYSLIYKILGIFIFIIIMFIYWNRKLKQEISERIIIQDELNKFLQVIEQSKVSIMLTDLEGKILYVNPYCIVESGFSKDELISSYPNIFKSGYQDNSFYEALWTTIKAGETWNGEFINKRKNGEIFWESATIAPIFDDEKNIRFFASVKQNITDRVKAQEDLIVAQEEANKANEAKSDFLAKMSHEIRTPMNAVLGMLYLLEKTKLNNNQISYIKKANLAASSLLGVINDILDFSKIEANKMEIKNSEFNIFELINDIMSIMSVKVDESDLELLTHFDEDIPVYIISDRLRIAQVLNNLISNAIKFTKKGEIFLSVSLVEKNSNGEAIIKFCVKDSGIGISKENQKKLFQEFTQVDNSATRSFNGTGLGLAISKKLTMLLGGDIWIESSQENVGTTICFTLKVKTTTKKEHVGFLFPLAMSNLRVLAVDDNSLALDVLCDMIETFDYSVDRATSGYEAIQLLKENNYDIVFLDYKMPNLSGLDTYIKYKSFLKEKTPKTIVVTAYSNEIIRKDIEKYGISGYLLKPITPSTLYDKIMEVLNLENLNKIDNKQTVIKQFENHNVLLVEDNELNREFATSILTEFGLSVDIAIDGLDAIEKVISKKYKLVLMDIQMPRMDGLEATKKIRLLNEEYFKNLPIIALSANALVGDEQKSLDVGMDAHITKPIDSNKLYNTLKRFIPQKPIDSLNEKQSEKKEYEYINKLDSKVFDIDEAMNRVANNETVYIRILHQFSENYKNLLEYVDKLLRKNDLELLEKKIHELKGVAGNIAAKRLYKVLSQLNAKLVNKLTLELELIDEFKESFTEVIDQIDKIKYEDKAKKKNFDKEKVIELLYDLKNNLNIDIVQSEKVLDELSSYLQDDYKDFFIDLSNSVNSFDSEKVNSLIDGFIKGIYNE